METNNELKYILGYVSKSLGFTPPLDFAFNSEKQFIFESIMFSAMTLYNNGGASKTKLAATHKRFEEDIEHKNEEKLSRTQELNTAKVQALKELGYTEINEKNASEVFDKNLSENKSETTNTEIKESSVVASLKVEDDTTVKEKINSLKEKLTDKSVSTEEKNNYFEELKLINKNSSKEETIELKIKECWNTLGEILGETYTDELLDELFQRFCLGK